MKHRKLRVAWSVGWGVVAALLLALWVRSYRWHDTVIFNKPPRASAAGWNKGELFFLTNLPPVTLRRLFVFQHEEPDYEHEWEGTHLGFRLDSMPGGFFLLVPFWFATIGAIAFGAVSQIRWSKRFSLGTLLIATTVVAVALGLIVRLRR